MIIVIACLALLSSCGATLPANPPTTEQPVTQTTPLSPAKLPVAQPPTSPASNAPSTRPTLAERAAKYDTIVQAQAAPGPSSTVPAGREYQDGFPLVVPAPKARADGSLQSFMALNTGPYLADRNVHNLTWTNSSGRPLAIYKVFLWTGVDKGGIVDVNVEARRASDNSYLGIQTWDHYADPTSPEHGQQFDYTTPMMLDPGETVTLRHYAIGFSPNVHAHHALILWVK
jgi:hypothetical protein